MTLLITYASVALGLSFLCSVLEAVLLSLTPSYVAARARDGSATGLRLKRLKDDVDRPLAAILSLNTIAHTMGAAGVGAEATRLWGSAWLGLVSVVLTLLILVVSEIIPKSVGARYWRQLAPFAARTLPAIMWLLHPLVTLSSRLTRLISKQHHVHLVQRDELVALAELAGRTGLFHPEELRLLNGVLRFGAVRVRDIMTPRTVVHMLPERSTVGEVLAGKVDLRFSRILVHGLEAEDVTGYVLKDEILLRAARDEDQTALQSLKRPLLVVPETLAVPQVLDRLLRHREHIALVVDEHGDAVGVVTLEDVIETVLGLEIVDEADTVHDMQELARQQSQRRKRSLGLTVDEDR